MIGWRRVRAVLRRQDPRDRADLGRRRPLEAAATHARHRRIRDQRLHRRRPSASTSSRSTPRRRLGHQEAYVVIAGHATFSLDGEEIDAPQGTVVFIRDPEGAPLRRRGRGRARRCSRSAASRACTPRRPGSGTSRPRSTARAATTTRRSSCSPTREERFPDHAGVLYSLGVLAVPGRRHRCCDRIAAGCVRAGSARAPSGPRVTPTSTRFAGCPARRSRKSSAGRDFSLCPGSCPGSCPG